VAAGLKEEDQEVGQVQEAGDLLVRVMEKLNQKGVGLVGWVWEEVLVD